MCQWILLPARDDDKQGPCDKPGEPYCSEHQREIDYIARLDSDWKEIEETHRAVCEEPAEEKQQLCAFCNSRPVHDGCFYCEECCQDDAFGLLGPQA